MFFFYIIYRAIGILPQGWNFGRRSRIVTYLGPFQGFGPNWEQVPNVGPHYEHCSCYLDFFFSKTKFSETETKTFCRDQIFSKPKSTFFPKPNFPKPKPILFSDTKFFETETEIIKLVINNRWVTIRDWHFGFETSRFRNFCQCFEGFGFGEFGIGKKVSVLVS